MNFTRIFERVIHFPRRVAREWLFLYDLTRFWLYNRLGSAPVTQPGGPVVSMTTWGKRIATVYLAIESIASGNIRPFRLILWIDDEKLFENLPVTLRRLEKRGLEVKLCKNYGPHTKYYPYVESEQEFSVPLVTADDDMLYPKVWLKMLAEANLKNQNNVNCFWGYVMTINGSRIGKSTEWKQIKSMHPSFRHHALGVTGVIYPSSFLSAVRRAGTAFTTCCPKNDDIWLHVQALRSGHKIRTIAPRLPYLSFHTIPGTWSTGLCRDNVDRMGNDSQIAATYNEADLQRLRAD